MKIIKKEKIKTERLILSHYSEKDIPALVEMFRNPQITKYFMVPDYKTEEEYIDLAKKILGFSQVNDTKHLEYGIFLDENLIGFLNDCGFDEEEIEVGYVIHPNYWGKGYATEALCAIIEECKEMGFKAVTAGYFEENIPSKKVMLKCRMVETDEVDTEEYRGQVLVCRKCRIDF